MLRLTERQIRRRQKRRQAKAVADTTGRLFEISACAARAVAAGRDRAVGAEGDIDMAGLKGSDQGNARNLDIADDEGRHVQRAV
ncbi:hypothetical protein EN792_060350, partial [Mesorhizobium sp. M00.F.Ca.ET.149.01.1.1]